MVNVMIVATPPANLTPLNQSWRLNSLTHDLPNLQTIWNLNHSKSQMTQTSAQTKNKANGTNDALE